jgi:ABC-type transport system involved in cytochrome c biogenesis permease subunit
MVIITALLLFSTVTCGLWIEYSRQGVERGSFAFHVIVGILAVIATMMTVVLSAEGIIAVRQDGCHPRRL